MIWVIMTDSDKDFYVSGRNKNFLTEVLGEGNVSFVTMSEDDDLSFIGCDDIVLVQTRNVHVIEKIEQSGARHTAESNFTILYTKNKDAVKDYILSKEGIPYPATISVDDEKNAEYPVFVKPLLGEDSNGVDEKSLCHTIQEVESKVKELKSRGMYPIIEKFIDGQDATVAVLQNEDGNVEVYPISIRLSTANNIMTHVAKMSEEEICSFCHNVKLIEYAKKAFKAVGCKHYMRIDFRIDKSGKPYLIDFNLFPGLGPTDHFSKCLSLCGNFSYGDIIKKILSTAKR